MAVAKPSEKRVAPVSYSETNAEFAYSDDEHSDGVAHAIQIRFPEFMVILFVLPVSSKAALGVKFSSLKLC